MKVDVFLTSNPLFYEVRKRHTTTRRFVEQDIPCATVEGLILLKLYALPSLYCQGNFTRVGLYENDVATLLHAHSPPIEPLLYHPAVEAVKKTIPFRKSTCAPADVTTQLFVNGLFLPR